MSGQIEFLSGRCPGGGAPYRLSNWVFAQKYCSACLNSARLSRQIGRNCGNFDTQKIQLEWKVTIL
jgi:hypothetical protein